MKKAVIFAAALLAGIQTLGGSLTAFGNTTVKTIVVNGSNLTEHLGELENLDLSQLGNCTVITIPCMPDTGGSDVETEAPSTPETEAPSTPETEETSTPETEAPSMPETEAPSMPETEAPSTSETEEPSTPETEAPSMPETEAPSMPETEAPSMPETEAPSTPETEAPGTPETEMPDENSYHAYVLRVVELVNEERAKAGLQPLTLKADITEAAQVRAVETVKSFSHTRPDGRHFSTALTEAGVSYRGAGENIAWGQKTPEQVMEGWMNSEGHRSNILNEKYTSIGVGYYTDSNGVNYWSQLFIY